MALLERLMFWKKKEVPELELGRYAGLEAGPAPGPMPELAPPGGPGITTMPHFEDFGPAPPPPMAMGEHPPAGMPAPGAFAPQPMPPPADMSRDMQVVQAKLDTLKAILDSINAKLDRLERAQAREEEAMPLAVRRWR